MDYNKEPDNCGQIHPKVLFPCKGNRVDIIENKINIVEDKVECAENKVNNIRNKSLLVVKIPVVLAEKDIQIDVETEIKLKDPFYEIKRVKKNIALTQCRIVATAGERDCHGKLISGKLFLEGFVEKNIEYATVDCATEKIISGDIRHTTVKVPFKAVTKIFYERPPIINYRSEPMEISFFYQGEKCCAEENFKIEKCETSFEEEICYNEKPYCELEGAKIYDTHTNIEEGYHEGVRIFNKIVEKMVIILRIKLLQVQQVTIS